MAQLTMIFPPESLKEQNKPNIPECFELRTFQPGDEDRYLEIMRNAGFEWTGDNVKAVLESALLEGIFFITDKKTGAFAATAMANRRAPARFGDGGELGWVAVNQLYRGHGLGKLVCRAVLNHYRELKYTHVYLLTDDCRLAALRIYLQSGWCPLMIDQSMPGRWKKVEETLHIPCIAWGWK